MKIFRFFPFVILGLIVLAAPVKAPRDPQVHTIELDSSQYEFSPNRLVVNQGDTLVITLTASDVVHGFYLDGYEIEQRVEPGISERIEFVAGKRGKFRYRCSVSCGTMHPFMIGEMVVRPNVPLWRAVGLLSVALTGAIFNLMKLNGGKE